MKKPIRGQLLFALFALAVAVFAAFSYTALRRAQHLRFAISIHAVPESPYKELVPLNVPIQVRIDKRTAGHSPLIALAMLLDGNGVKLRELQPMAVRTLPSGKLTEEATFEPLTALPGQGLLAGVVVRLPADTPELRARIESALTSGQAKKPSLPRVFSHMLATSRELGGHAELTQVMVREKL
ncbi:MAG: hypothetical protein U1A78_28325 [Polyangia bacterium]